jgi:CRISPR/Cas system-associated protein Cas10 (large subunit of type III CRISPR-Cas system)
VRDKARIRLIAMIEPALTVLSDVMADKEAAAADRIRAANSVLDRAGYARVAVLDVEAARDVLTERIITIMENDSTKPGATP